MPILVGLFIGRIGCFIAGLQDDTYGIPTSLPCGLSGIQLVCAVTLIFYLPLVARQLSRLNA